MPLSRLTAAQEAMLRNERAGRSLFYGLTGRSAHGGGHHTMMSLLKSGLLRRSGGISPRAVELLDQIDKATPPSETERSLRL